MTRRVVLATLVAALASAQSVPAPLVPGNAVPWAPPASHWPDTLGHSTIPREMVASLQVDGTNIKLEDTNLVDMQRRFGGTIGQSGDASEFLAWLCLSGHDATGPYVLWVTSGEIDRPAVGGFRWQHLESGAHPDPRCHALPPDATVRLPIPVRLGMTQASFEKLLGRPSARQGDNVLYIHEHNLTLHNLPYTSINTVEVDYKNRVVSAIAAEKSTTD